MGAEILAEGEPGSPRQAVINSAEAGPGDLFFGLVGANHDGGKFAPAAIEAGAWGAVVSPEWRSSFIGEGPIKDERRWVFSVADPLAALQALARESRRALGARVVGITGSVGKTSVKDITRALLPGRVHANRENLNTEIGLPLTILQAPDETEALVLEMAMRGKGQIAELAAIAEPEVAVITNVGPVHVELLGSIAAIAAAKAEILGDLPPGGTAVAPVEAGELEPHLAPVAEQLRFGPGGDVEAVEAKVADGVTEALVETPLGTQRFHFPFAEAHNLTNALAAIAAGVALGADTPAYHREVGEHARASGVDLVVGVGEPARDYDPDELVADPGEAAEWLASQLEAGDAVLIKGSRSAGLETVAAALPEMLEDGDG